MKIHHYATFECAMKIQREGLRVKPVDALDQVLWSASDRGIKHKPEPRPHPSVEEPRIYDPNELFI